MSKMSSINVRVDDELKAQAERVMSDYGLNMSTTVNMLLKQIVREQAIPLSLGKRDDVKVLSDLLASQIARANGHQGTPAEKVAKEMRAVIDKVRNEQAL